MELRLVGLSHKTAPIEIREKVFLEGESLARAFRELSAHGTSDEWTILSTCNRTEIYTVSDGAHSAEDRLISYLTSLSNANPEAIRTSIYFLESSQMVRHLLRVATGIESMVVGEGQVLGQVREAGETARSAGVSGPVLNSLFNQAVAAGKRARTETNIARGAVSVSHVAVELARRLFQDLKGKSVTLVGAGKMSEVALRYLLKQGVSKIEVVNRSPERANVLAASLGAEVVRWDDLHKSLIRSDLVVTSTASDEPIVSVEDMKRVMWERRGRPILMIDIAVPRDVDAEVANLSDVYLYNIDDLQTVTAQNLSEREKEIPKVLQIIEEEEAAFFKWLTARAQFQGQPVTSA